MHYWQYLGVACDNPSYVLGNFIGIRTTRSFPDIARSTYSKFKGMGPFCSFYWLHHPAFFVLETSLAKAGSSNSISSLIMDSIRIQLMIHFLDVSFRWTVINGAWDAKLSPTFTSGKMEHMFRTVTRVGTVLVNIYNEAVSSGSTIEVSDFLARYTMGVIGSCAFGIDCNILRNPKDLFLQMGRRVFTDQRHGISGQALIILFPKLSRCLHIKMTPDHIIDFYMRIVRENIAYIRLIYRRIILNITPISLCY